MSQDLSIIPGPSVAETLFLISVHEMGHALGLQHTYTSSAMSTIATRATSLTEPIGDDDRAGLSLLYPANNFASQAGSITGTVTYAGSNAPVHMASVVAIRYGAPAISALTRPDGTFEIDGLATAQYFLYVHPLPPPQSADIRSPLDSNGNSVDPSQPFDAVVYPGVVNLLNASTVTVTAGQTTSGMNFSVTPRADVPIYDVQIYSYFYPAPDQYIPAHPAFVSEQQNPGLVVALGNGLGSNGSTADGLDVQVMGGTAAVQDISAYVPSNSQDTALEIDLSFSNFGAAGRQHLLFATPDYLYILPSGFNVVQNQPPTISSVTANGDGSVAVAGANFAAGMNFYFDSLPGTLENLDLANQIATVVPPAGASGQVATMAADNPDGQSSMFLQADSPVQFTYAALQPASLTILPGALPAANEAKIDIIGTNTNFSNRTAVGFGSHDVVVRNTFVLSPTHLIVDVSIPGGAAQITTQVSALTDFQLVDDPQAFQIQPPQPGLPAAVPILFNAVPTQSGSFPGAVVTIYGANLTDANNDAPIVTLNAIPVGVLYASATQLNVTIPAGLSAGLATLLVNNTQQTSYPTIVSIAPPEPVVTGINLAGQAIDSTTAVNAGLAVDVLLTGLTNPGSSIDPSRVQVSVGGVTMPALSVSQVGSSNVYDVQFDLSAMAPSGSQTLIVYVDGESSTTASVTVAAAATSSGS